MEYDIYVLRCEDNSLYCGIARDYEKRYIEHINGRGAKYTKSRKPMKVEAVWEAKNRSEATKIEIYFKKYSKLKKEDVLIGKINFKKEVLEKKEINIKEKKVEEVGALIEKK